MSGLHSAPLKRITDTTDSPAPAVAVCPRRVTLAERMNVTACDVVCAPWPPMLRARIATAIAMIQARALDSAVLELLDVDMDLAGIDRADAIAPYGRDPREVAS